MKKKVVACFLSLMLLIGVGGNLLGNISYNSPNTGISNVNFVPQIDPPNN